MRPTTGGSEREQVVRRWLLFLAGLGIIGHEVLVWQGPERWLVMGVAMAMVGLPAFWPGGRNGKGGA